MSVRALTVFDTRGLERPLDSPEVALGRAVHGGAEADSIPTSTLPFRLAAAIIALIVLPSPAGALLDDQAVPLLVETFEEHPDGSPPLPVLWSRPFVECRTRAHAAIVTGEAPLSNGLDVRVVSGSSSSGGLLYRSNVTPLRRVHDLEVEAKVEAFSSRGGSSAREVIVGIDAHAVGATGYRLQYNHYPLYGRNHVELLALRPLPVCGDPEANHDNHRLIHALALPRSVNPFATPVDLRFGLRSDGESLTALLDGTVLFTVRDATFRGGDVGLFVHAGDGWGAPLPVSARFDDIVVRAPARVPAPAP